MYGAVQKSATAEERITTQFISSSFSSFEGYPLRSIGASQLWIKNLEPVNVLYFGTTKEVFIIISTGFRRSCQHPEWD